MSGQYSSAGSKIRDRVPVATSGSKILVSDIIMRRSKGRATLIVLSLYVMVIVSCGSSQESCEGSNEDRITISQGVWGNICFWKGNFMPTVHSDGIADRILDIFKSRDGTIIPVVREIYISRVITLKEMSDSDVALPRAGFFSVITAKIVATTSSDKKGFYQLELPRVLIVSLSKKITLFTQTILMEKGELPLSKFSHNL